MALPLLVQGPSMGLNSLLPENLIDPREASKYSQNMIYERGLARTPYGFAKLGPKHKDVETITLRPDETVTVWVVDGEKRGVSGVPVGVLQRIPSRRDPLDLQELFVRMKMLEGHMDRVVSYVRTHPGQRNAVVPKVRAIREEQRKIHLAIGQQKSRGNRRGSGRSIVLRTTGSASPRSTTRKSLKYSTVSPHREATGKDWV